MVEINGRKIDLDELTDHKRISKGEAIKRVRMETGLGIMEVRPYITEYYGTKGRKLVKTRIIAAESQKSTASAVGRGAIGGAIFGAFGAAVGLMTTKNKNSTTFLLIYDNGETETKTVLTRSSAFNQYSKYLDI